MKSHGSFMILRSGVLEHLIAGELGFAELGIYAVVHLQADFSTGIWRGSAPRLLAAGPRGMSLREVQRRLQTLTKIRFLRPFHRHGARGNFPWLIDKYEVKLGALKGSRLNAWKSVSWRSPIYESCADGVADSRDATVAEAAPYQETGSIRQERETQPSWSSKPPSNITIARPVPEWIPIELWESFVAMRRAIRKPLTHGANDLLLKKLEALKGAGHDPISIVEESIANGWAGFYAPRKESGLNGNSRQDRRPTGSIAAAPGKYDRRKADFAFGS